MTDQEEYNPNITTLDDDQEIVMSILSAVSGSLSLIGSSLIVYRVFKNRGDTTPYDRLMLCLSICDVISSLSFGVGPVMLPADSSPRPWASGNDKSCSALGAMTQFSFAAVWYNGLLSIYYLLTVRFGVRRKVFAKKYERPMHILSMAFFISTSVSGLIIGLYSELEITQGCWIGQYPADCEALGTCRGTWIGWIFGGFPFVFTFLSLPVNNIVIFLYVRRRLGPTNTAGSPIADGRDKAQTQRMEAQHLRIREVASQGFLYVMCFYVCYTPAFIIRVLEGLGMNGEKESDIYPVLVLNSLLLPLQGLFNVFIYSRPNYIRVRNAFPEQNKLWVIRHCLLETDIPSLTSRYSSQTTGGRRSGTQNGGNPKQSSRRSKGSSAGSLSLGFSGSLEMVLEDSQEDMSSDAFQLSSQRKQPPAVDNSNNTMPVVMEHERPMSEESSASISSWKDSSAKGASASVESNGDLEPYPLGESKKFRMNMDGSVT